MKKTLYTLGFACLASLSLLSCSKGDYNSGDLQTGYNTFADANNKTQSSSSNFTAKINGSDFKADNGMAQGLRISADKSLLISGSKSAGNQGFIFNISSQEKGTYSVSSSKCIMAYVATGGTTTVYATEGSVEITEITDIHAKGTFNMKGSGIDVTEGSFDVPLKTQ